MEPQRSHPANANITHVLLPPPRQLLTRPDINAKRPNTTNSGSAEPAAEMASVETSSLRNPPVFDEAMEVRTTVFVHEQRCSADGEFDDQDARCWHWVFYDVDGDSENVQDGVAKVDGEAKDDDTAKPLPEVQAKNNNNGKIKRKPIGTIRLVPPPHESHYFVLSPAAAAVFREPPEPYIKLGRIALLPAYRGRGLARTLVKTVLTWASQHAEEISSEVKEIGSGSEQELRRESGEKDGEKAKTEDKWKGLVLVHAQLNAEKMYVRLGFVRDESMGTWVEEGIEHVGMWMRWPVKA